MLSNETELGSPGEAAGIPILGILRRRKGIIFFCFAVGLGLAYLQHMQKPVFFRSRAQILVDQKSPPALPLGAMDQQRQFLADKANIRTQELVLKSPLVIDRAIETPELVEIRSHFGSEPVVAISTNLSIREVDAPSNVLELSYLSSNPGDSQRVLEAMISSYQDYLGTSQQNVGEETKKLITEAKDDLLEQIRVKEANYRKFKQEAPLLWVEEKGQNYFQDRLQSIENERAQIVVERKKLEAQLKSIQEAIEHGENREAIMLMAGESLEREAGSSAKKSSPLSHLLPLYIERQDLMHDYGPDHPKVVAVNSRIELTRKFLQDMDGEVIEAEEAGSESTPTNFLDVYIAFLEGQIRQSKLRESLLTDLFDEVQAQAKSLADFEAQDETYRSELERLRQLFSTVVKRVDELSLIKDIGGFEVSVLHPPSPDIATQLDIAQTLGLGGFFGLLTGFGLAYLVDTARKTFYSAEEISSSLHLPLIGHIPVISTRELRKVSTNTTLDPMLYTYASPRASISEAFRAVRTALYFSSEGKDHRIVQVTSPTPGDGKTTLVTNLAVTIAQSGKRTLLLDADFRKPRLHRLFKLDNEVGLASVIDGKAELNDAIQETEVNNLFVMTCGHRPSNPSELLSSPRFQELLEVLREKYDYVLIDTPPLLAVTDPSTVAPRVDSVILTIRLRKGSRPNAERASEMLRSLRANLLGIVVNGVEKGRGYRYYSGGSYYGGYRNSNGYGYGYGGSDGYYGEEEDRQEQRLALLNGRKQLAKEGPHA